MSHERCVTRLGRSNLMFATHLQFQDQWFHLVSLILILPNPNSNPNTFLVSKSLLYLIISDSKYIGIYL